MRRIATGTAMIAGSHRWTNGRTTCSKLSAPRGDKSARRGKRAPTLYRNVNLSHWRRNVKSQPANRNSRPVAALPVQRMNGPAGNARVVSPKSVRGLGSSVAGRSKTSTAHASTDAHLRLLALSHPPKARCLRIPRARLCAWTHTHCETRRKSMSPLPVINTSSCILETKGAARANAFGRFLYGRERI